MDSVVAGKAEKFADGCLVSAKASALFSAYPSGAASYPKLATESLVVKTTPSIVLFHLVQGVKTDVS